MNIKNTGSAKKAGYDGDENRAFLGSFIKSFTRTEEFREVVHAALPEVFTLWAGKSRIKKKLAGTLGRFLAKGFAPRGESAGSPVLETCGDPEFIRQASTQMPEIFNAVIAGLNAFSRGLSEMPVDEHRRCLKSVIENADAGGIGELITNLFKSANLHRSDPDSLVETLRPKVRSLIAGIDFGELKEAVDGSADSVTALTEMINEEMWEYPAKMVCLLSLLPSLLNMAVRSAVKTTAPINRLAPDLLTDVVLSLVREIDGKSIGSLINELCEIIRKIHTGSSLIGDRGNHAFSAAVSQLGAATLGSVDILLLLKARGMLRDIGDLARISAAEILGQNPAIAADFFQGHFRSLVSWVRAWSLKADIFERVFTDEDIAREFARGMGELDAQEMAFTASSICGLFNQVRRLSPGTIKNFLSQFFSSLNESTVADAARWFTGDLVQSMEPIAPEIMPPIISGIAELIAPHGEMSAEMQEACEKLRNVFNRKEVSA
ncbi:MAG: hypothetical protein CVV44_14190 [Spirochaetae bacterium HGW-Spirochaetae-1]|jgi:hypothetical protein|nr:MAG: hypothetical protein CVV44_14190 [Spirochaetae bacterium HGW-Spirochaetae-1]